MTIGERLRSARRTLDPEGINTTIIEQARQHLPDVQAACGALGFFGATRLVVAIDLFGEAKSNNQSGQAQSGAARSGRGSAGKRGRGANAAADDAVVALLAGVPSTTELVVVERSFDTQAEQLTASSGARVAVERHDVPRGQPLLQWLVARARQHDTVIEAPIAEEILNALFPGSWQSSARFDDVPPDLFRLDNEIAKLSAAAGTGPVTTDLVRQLVLGADAENTWGLVDALTGGQPSRAVQEVERALSHGTAPEALLGQLTGHFEALAAILLAGRGTSPREIAAATGLSDGRVRMASSGAQRTSIAAVAGAIDALRTLDADAKRGRVEPADALVALVARLASGESR
ncbi:MAG TPA: DNA polymerase III subunit delta [Nitrolancea sp.]|nr:DNA polymerase III subunit delta [Nitrolancea sp.]